METVESFECGDATDETKTLQERRRKASPLSIQVRSKKQKTEHAAQQKQDAEEQGHEGQQPMPDYSWMAKWAHVPSRRFRLNPRIIYCAPITCNVFDYPFPSLGGLPLEIATRIFTHLDAPWQICLALSCKAFGHASYHVNSGHGLIYSRGQRLRLMWRLKPSMGWNRKLCAYCERYRPIDPKVWKERKQHGRARTNSRIYGKHRDDFNFDGEDCPECTAEKRWNQTRAAHGVFLRELWHK